MNIACEFLALINEKKEDVEASDPLCFDWKCIKYVWEKNITSASGSNSINPGRSGFSHSIEIVACGRRRGRICGIALRRISGILPSKWTHVMSSGSLSEANSCTNSSLVNSSTLQINTNINEGLPIIVDDCSASGFFAPEDPTARIFRTITPYPIYFNRLLNKSISQPFAYRFLSIHANKYKAIDWNNYLAQNIKSIRNIPTNTGSQSRGAKLMVLFRIPRERQ